MKKLTLQGICGAAQQTAVIYDRKGGVGMKKNNHSCSVVWIGANAVITAGVIIGKHCVIGAGSVVTKDIPDGSVAVGSPARIVKQ